MGWGLHSFLLHLALGELPVPGLERVTLVGVDKDGRVHIMHSLFSVRVNVYSTECQLFACLRKLPAEGLPPVMEISPKLFAARHSVHAVPQSDHIAHLGGISSLDLKTKPCERAVGPDNINLACRGMAFFPYDFAAWILRGEADRPGNVFEASTGLFPILTGRDPPFEAALNWLQFTYTADRAGAYVAPVSTVLVQSAVAEGGNLFPELLSHLRRQYPEVYVFGVDTAWAYNYRELILGEG